MRRRASARAGHRLTFPGALLLAALVVALYGRTLGAGFLSDDFLYLTWAEDGFGSLFARLTTESCPRTLRPLLAPVWWLAAELGSALVVRVAGLAAHLVSTLLVSHLTAVITRSKGVGLAAGALFAAFPLAPEAVAWPSGTFDLVACTFALGSLVLLIPSEEESARMGAAVVLFGVGLFAKESILVLPVVALILFGGRMRRGALWMICIGAGYLGFRFLLFDGPGGYLDATGGSLLSLSTLPGVVAGSVRTLTLAARGRSPRGRAHGICGSDSRREEEAMRCHR